jgi:hypothetical protein
MHSYLKSIGSAGTDQIPTWFEIPVMMGMPFMCGKAKPFIVSPIAYPVDYIASIAVGPDHHQAAETAHTHIIHKALEWRRMLDSAKALTMSKIADNQGYSRARVTQIMNLLHLPSVIVKDLCSVSTPEQSRCYSERFLRGILTLPTAAEQIQAFRSLDCPTPPGHSA